MTRASPANFEAESSPIASELHTKNRQTDVMMGKLYVIARLYGFCQRFGLYRAENNPRKAKSETKPRALRIRQNAWQGRSAPPAQ